MARNAQSETEYFMYVWKSVLDEKHIGFRFQSVFV